MGEARASASNGSEPFSGRDEVAQIISPLLISHLRGLPFQSCVVNASKCLLMTVVTSQLRHKIKVCFQPKAVIDDSMSLMAGRGLLEMLFAKQFCPLFNGSGFESVTVLVFGASAVEMMEAFSELSLNVLDELFNRELLISYDALD